MRIHQDKMVHTQNTFFRIQFTDHTLGLQTQQIVGYSAYMIQYEVIILLKVRKIFIYLYIRFQKFSEKVLIRLDQSLNQRGANEVLYLLKTVKYPFSISIRRQL